MDNATKTWHPKAICSQCESALWYSLSELFLCRPITHIIHALKAARKLAKTD